MCEFENYVALCAQPITDQISAYITATVNRCRQPVDVTFLVESSNHTHSWEHTFVNTNEVQYLPSFWPDASLEVHLTAFKNNASLQAVRILAALFVDDLMRPFLNSTLVINPEHCKYSGSMFTIALILLVAFVLLLITTVGIFLCLRYGKGKKKTKNNSYADELLRNPDGVISSAHLQEGVSFYDNPAHSSTTLIRNSVYRDTVCPETPPQRSKFSLASPAEWFKTDSTPRYAGSRLKTYPRQAISTVDVDTHLDRY